MFLFSLVFLSLYFLNFTIYFENASPSDKAPHQAMWSKQIH
ncbi:hypothetical protein MADA3029_460061 [Vibrio nigripulchritudo MADA3029]|nr:hypothetical protein VIBNIMADA3020_1250043 [Vibrio nigripulchritudo MADA3020]CCN55080.1 hypothetical protein VIBNIMADA3021_680043 [Vibrio nigripulchritudo MADA3021]CCN59690.1 hypothetical protein MADA3029_460061 [Vibrio nigripulchritudo MADA3029]